MRYTNSDILPPTARCVYTYISPHKQKAHHVPKNGFQAKFKGPQKNLLIKSFGIDKVYTYIN